jgi:hypothetical protein
MKKSRGRTSRGHKYQALARGYKIMNSPLAASFQAAAEYYDGADAPHDRAGPSEAQADECPAEQRAFLSAIE